MKIGETQNLTSRFYKGYKCVVNTTNNRIREHIRHVEDLWVYVLPMPIVREKILGFKCETSYVKGLEWCLLKEFEENDLIAISDLDEIPNFENFRYKNKITFFEQKMFYYKLNLIYPNFIWVGSKICKKKHLINPQWLRNVKSKIYPYWRLDTYFSKKNIVI